MNHLQYAFRQLRKSPGFTTVCVLTLALGIGANTAVFSVTNAVLLKSLPVADPERVVYLHTSAVPHDSGTISRHETFSYAVYDELRHHPQALSSVIAYAPLSTGKVAVRYGPLPEEAEGEMVSGNFFSGLGIKLARGRGFEAVDEDRHAPVAVISYNYWTRRFARDPGILGKTLFVKGVAFQIVGVSPEDFEGTEGGHSADFWIPLQARPELNAYGNPPDSGKIYLQNSAWWCLRLIARLAPGVSRNQAASQLQAAFQNAAYFGRSGPDPGEQRPTLSLHEAKNFPGYDEDYGKPLRMLMGMVGLVLLIALSNVAMLLLARNATRQREFSLRMAVGAGRGQLFRQLLTESALLVGLGGGLAWGFALSATRTLAAWARIESSLVPDRTVLLFTLAILVAAALLFGLAPMRAALATGPGLVLKTSQATSNLDVGKSRTARTVVALQIALSVVLLVGGALLFRTLRNLQTLPLGMRTEGLVVFGVNPQNTHTNAEAMAFYRELLAKLRVLPGVKSAALMEQRLGTGWSNNRRMIADGKPSDGQAPLVRSNAVGPDFFHTLGVPLLAGRDFNGSDTLGAPQVIMVNERFAKVFFGGESPIGHHVQGERRDPNDVWQIVGVVADHKYRSVDEEPIPMAWYPYTQNPRVGAMHVEMRVGGPPLAILPVVRKVVQQLDPELPLIEPITQRSQFDRSISQQLLFARLGEFFGLLAVLLVATGLYGTLSYRVNNRTIEIGVRMAVGAQRRQVVWMVLRDSLLLTAAGALIGLPLAALVGRTLSSALYGVKPYDALTFAFAIFGIAFVALLASALPARRAASVDPLSALRAE